MSQANQAPLRRSLRFRNQNNNQSHNQNHNHNEENILPPEIPEENVNADESNDVQNIEEEPLDQQQLDELAERFPRRQLDANDDEEPALIDNQPEANEGDGNGDGDEKEEQKVDGRRLPQQNRGHSFPDQYIINNEKRKTKWKNFRARYHKGFQTMCLQTQCSGSVSYWDREQIGLQPQHDIFLSPDYEYKMMEDITMLTQWTLELQQTTLAARLRARIPINTALIATNDEPLDAAENNLAHDGNNTLDPESARRALRNSTADILLRSYQMNVLLGCVFENIVAERFGSSSRSYIYNELAVAPPELPPELDRNDDSIAPMPVIDPLSRFVLNIVDNNEDVAVVEQNPNHDQAANNEQQQDDNEIDGN